MEARASGRQPGFLPPRVLEDPPDTRALPAPAPGGLARALHEVELIKTGESSGRLALPGE